MSDDIQDIPALLVELINLPDPERVERLRKAGRVDETLMALGDEAERLASVEVKRSLTAGEVLVSLADQIQAVCARVRVRRAYAHALAYAGNLEEAIAVCDDGLAISGESANTVEGARLKMAMLHPLCMLGKYEQAATFGEEAHDELLESGRTDLAARVDINLGNLEKSRGRSDPALMHLDRARDELRDEPEMLGPIENCRGEVLLQLNDFDGAFEAFQSALHTFRETGSTFISAMAEGNLADLAARRGELQKALVHFENARRAFDKDTAAGHSARLIMEQADAIETLGMPDDALATYDDALPRLDELGLAWEHARAMTGRGRALLRLGRHAEAEQVLLDASQRMDTLGQHIEHARLKIILAELAIATGRLDTAEQLLVESIETLRDLPVDTAVALFHQSRLAVARNDLDGARDALDRAIATAQAYRLAPLLAELHQARGDVHNRQENSAQAIADLQAAVGHVERVRGTFQAERFRAAYLGGRVSIYEDLVRTVLDQREGDAIDRAFAAVEQAKSRSLLDIVRRALDEIESDISDEDDPDEAALLSELTRRRSELSALYSRLEDPGQADQRRVATAAWQSAIVDCERRLEELEGRLTTTRGVAGLYSPPATIEQVRAALPEQTSLVEYFLADGELLAFVLNNRSATVYRGMSEVDGLLDGISRVQFQLRRAMRPDIPAAKLTRLVEDFNRESESLHSMLVSPLCEALADSPNLVIVPHGPLHYVPFHALRCEHGYLIENHTISYAPSGSLYVHAMYNSEDTQPSENNSDLVVGVSDTAAPRIDQETTRIASVFGNGTVLQNDQARIAAVKEAARDAATIHFACHGRFWQHSPMSSGLKLADGWLTARDLFDLRLKARLVVLSGCETGRSLVRTGDELIGLVRGFFAAGVSSLIVSLWTVNDMTATELMSRFYSLRRKTNKDFGSVAAALREAQLHIIKDRPHPAFWAPFILIGRS